MVVVIHDLGLAAYLKAIKQKTLVKAPYKDEKGRFCFEFDLNSEKEKNELTMEYFNSAYRLFDQELRTLKRSLSLLTSMED